jgi:DNA replication and repair protein RecF
LVLCFSSRFVVFYGENGAGKTNILEAISLFSSDRGLRKAPLADLTYSKAAPFSCRLESVIKKNDCETFLSTNIGNGRRTGAIDGVSADSLSKFEEIMWILWVIPAMNNIFIGPAADRRSFFDHLVGGCDGKHRKSLKNLSKLQKERLHAIFHGRDNDWLNVLERKIAEENAILTRSRMKFLRILEETFESSPSAFLRPKVNLSGTAEKILESRSEEDAISEMADLLKRNRLSDSERQSTSVSCQKTFWRTEHPKTSFEAEQCSTGEQKAFLISLILAALRIYRETRSGIPVLLLDDLMVHLDETHRKKLAEELASLNVQTFFTGTDPYLFEDLKGLSQIYRVEKSICTAK